jgi:hypothetical protein
MACSAALLAVADAAAGTAALLAVAVTFASSVNVLGAAADFAAAAVSVAVVLAAKPCSDAALIAVLVGAAAGVRDVWLLSSAAAFFALLRLSGVPAAVPLSASASASALVAAALAA